MPHRFQTGIVVFLKRATVQYGMYGSFATYHDKPEVEQEARASLGMCQDASDILHPASKVFTWNGKLIWGQLGTSPKAVLSVGAVHTGHFVQPADRHAIDVTHIAIRCTVAWE